MKYSLMVLFLLFLSSYASFANASDPYAKADSIAYRYFGHSLKNIKSLTDKLTGSLPTSLQKYRAIFMWVCSNIESDYDTYLKNKIRRRKLKNHPLQLAAWNRKVSRLIFDRLRNEKRTLCTGYAYLIREMAYHAGIECRIINGLGRMTDYDPDRDGLINHSWNEVIIDGQIFLSDATWSSGLFDMRTHQFIKSIDDAYFLVKPSVFHLNHLSSATMDSATVRKFLQTPLIHPAAVTHQITPHLPDAYISQIEKGARVKFYIAVPANPKEQSIYLEVRGRKTGYFQSADEGRLVAELSFGKKGKFPVCVMIDGRKAISYLFQIK